MPDEASLRTLSNIDNTQDVSLSNILLDNFISLYDWGLTDKGSYYNINIPQSGIFGGNRDKLRPVKDERYNDGQVWEGYRQNWVWQTGLSVGTPIQISGVFVDGTFRATGNVQDPYYINYPDGRVVFDNAVHTTGTVHLAFSHRSVQVVPAEGVPWFRQVQQGSFRSDNPTFTQFGSGDWAQLGDTRVQLPCMAVDVMPPSKFHGFQLGGGQYVYQDVVFYVLAEHHWQVGNLIDIVAAQNDRTIHLFNPDSAGKSGCLPLNYRNELTSHALASGRYPDLISNFLYRTSFIHETRSQDITQLSPDLYMGSIRCTTETTPY